MRSLIVAVTLAGLAAPVAAGVPASSAQAWSMPTQLNCATTQGSKYQFNVGIQNAGGPALGAGSQIVIFGNGGTVLYAANATGVLTNPVTITLAAPLPVGGRTGGAGGWNSLQAALRQPNANPPVYAAGCRAFVSVARPLPSPVALRAPVKLPPHR
jgi:hypothetical protein